MLKENPIIKEVRDVRHRISEESGHDIKRLLKRYQRMAEERRASGKYRYEDDGSLQIAIPLTEGELLALNDKPKNKA